MNGLRTVTAILTIIGAINWGLVGLANFDLVAAIFGEMSTLSRIIYTLVGIAGIHQLIVLVTANREHPRESTRSRI